MYSYDYKDVVESESTDSSFINYNRIYSVSFFGFIASPGHYSLGTFINSTTVFGTYIIVFWDYKEVFLFAYFVDLDRLPFSIFPLTCSFIKIAIITYTPVKPLLISRIASWAPFKISINSSYSSLLKPFSSSLAPFFPLIICHPNMIVLHSGS